MNGGSSTNNGQVASRPDSAQRVVLVQQVKGTRFRRSLEWSIQRRRALFTVLVVACYLTIGVTAFWPMLPGTTDRLFDQADGDPVQTVWFFAWAAHAVTTGHNPLFTNTVNVPFGFNLAQAPAIPLLGLVALPVTVVVGPVASATLFMVAAMPLSAASAYAVLCHWRVWAPAAALGGLAYGFSPYMVAQGLVHLNLVFVPLPPLIVAVVAQVLTRPRHPLRWGSVLAALITAQYFISSEILAITMLICVAGIAIVAGYCLARTPGAIRAAWPAAASALGATLILTGAALAYPFWYQVSGPAHYVGPAWPINNPWYADALDFVAPSPRQAVAPVLRSVGTALSAPTGVENGAYIGVAVLAILVFLVWHQQTSQRVRLAAALAVVSGVLSLGRYLVVDRRGGNLPLPFDLLAHFPAIDNILPIRFAFTTGACVAAVIAFGLDGLRARSRCPLGAPPRQHSPALTTACAFTVVALVLVLTWLPTWPYPTQAVMTLPAGVTKALPTENPIVLAYPYPVAPEDQAYLWQAVARFSFRLLGVYGRVPAPSPGPLYSRRYSSPRPYRSFWSLKTAWPGTPHRRRSRKLSAKPALSSLATA